MNWFEAALELLGSGLKIWEHKERRKYQEKFYEIEKRYYKERNKKRPDNAILDNLEFELFILSKAFSSEIRK